MCSVFCFQGDRFAAVTVRQGLSGNGIRSVKADREGNLWVGTRSAGINRLSHRKVMSLGVNQGLTNDFARGVAQTADGRLWIGTHGGGLVRRDPDGTFTTFRHDDADPASLAVDRVTSVLAWSPSAATPSEPISRRGKMPSQASQAMSPEISSLITAISGISVTSIWSA